MAFFSLGVRLPLRPAAVDTESLYDAIICCYDDKGNAFLRRVSKWGRFIKWIYFSLLRQDQMANGLNSLVSSKQVRSRR